MLNLRQVELLKEYSVGIVFAELEMHSYSTIMDELQNGNIPKEVLVAREYYTKDPQQIIEHIDSVYSVLETLATDLINLTDKK